MRRLGHPSQQKLQRWVQGQDRSLDRHLATCNHCADRLEPLVGNVDDSIRSALLHLLDVPEQLPERLRAGIDKRMKNQQDLSLLGEFFGLPLRTVRVITAADQGDD